MQKNIPFQTPDQQEDTLNIRELIDKYWRHKGWIALSVVLCLLAAYIYAHYSTPVFESKASVLIEQNKPSTGSAEIGMLQDLGIVNGGGELEDEIEKFKSRTLMERVVRDLHLQWSFENIGIKTGIVRGEFFDDCPVSVNFLDADSTLDNKKFALDIELISDHKYTILKGEQQGKHSFGAVLKTSIGRIIIAKNPDVYPKNLHKVIGIRLSPFREVVEAYQRSLSVESASKEANIIVLGLKGNHIGRNNAVLNSIIRAHQENAILSKNAIVRNTTNFINERMKYIAAELSDVEKEGESFKTEHHLIDVTSDAASYLGKESELEKQVVETTIEKNLVEFMMDFLKEQKGYDQLLPANMGFKEQSIVLMTTQYNELVLERNRLRETNGDKNPAVARVESQLGSLRSSLETSLKNLKNSLVLQLKKLSNEEAIYQSKIASIPQFERAYRDILRQQQIKETLYLFLLQKREENEISLAATVSNTQVIDQAYSNEIPVSPKKKVIYLGAFILGILIPIGFIYVRNLLNNKINSRAELEKVGLSILADLPLSKPDELIVLNKPTSSLAESFRVLRSGLNFAFTDEKPGGRVVSITSTIGGEGKTFTSVNLAFMFAATGKKVLVVGVDLRKPRLKVNLELKADKGISNLIVDKNLSWRSCVESKMFGSHEIDILISGDIPPNPSELLMSTRLDEVIAEMRTVYDLIILDNAPVGLVVDAMTVNRLTDATIYVVRSGSVDKRMLPRIAELIQQQKLKNVFFVLNGVKPTVGAYYYQYGYGYGEHAKRSFLQKLRIKK